MSKALQRLSSSWRRHAATMLLACSVGAWLISPATAAGNDWPLARGGYNRLGAAPGEQGPTHGKLNWLWKDGDEGFFSTPAVVGNRVYVASALIGKLAESGQIYCFDAETGQKVWTCAPAGFRPTFSSPVISGNYLVCGEGLHITRDARVVCLDISGAEPKVLWTYRTNSHVECTPVIANNRVYVGAGDDGYYCFDLQPGPNGEGRVIWHVPGDKYQDAETALTVYDGKVYAGLGIGGKALCVLDASTGTELQRLPMPYPVFSPPAIADGKLYLGMGNGDFVNTGRLGEVRCLDLATLKTEWSFPLEQTVLGSIAVTSDRLYFGSSDGKVYSLDRAGKRIASFDTHAPVSTSPAVTDQCVYVLNDAGVLYGLDRDTLAPMWDFMVGTKPLFISSPVAARGHVYVGSQYDGLLCVGQPGAGKVTPVWPGRLGGNGSAGNLDDSPLPDPGAFHWQYPADAMGETANAVMQAPAAALGSNIIVPLAMAPGPGVACFPADAGTAETPAPKWMAKTSLPVVISPAIVGDNVLVVDGKAGDAGRTLTCLDIATGEQRWQLPVDAAASGALTATATSILVQQAPDTLTCLDLTGTKLWSSQTGALAQGAAVSDTAVIVASQQPAALIALDSKTGKETWRATLDAQPVGAPAVAGDLVYVPTAAGVDARDLASGARHAGWKLDGGPATADIALSAANLLYVNGAGELIVASREDGSVRSRTPGALPGTTPLPSRNAALYWAADGLMRLDLTKADAKPTQWTDTSWLGKATSPMVLRGSNVYVGIAGWGMIRFGKSR